MQELIETIVCKTGLSPKQAREAVHTVAHFVKEQYPLMQYTIDSVLGTEEGWKEAVLPEPQPQLR